MVMPEQEVAAPGLLELDLPTMDKVMAPLALALQDMIKLLQV